MDLHGRPINKQAAIGISYRDSPYRLYCSIQQTETPKGFHPRLFVRFRSENIEATTTSRNVEIINASPAKPIESNLGQGSKRKKAKLRREQAKAEMKAILGRSGVTEISLSSDAVTTTSESYSLSWPVGALWIERDL